MHICGSTPFPSFFHFFSLLSKQLVFSERGTELEAMAATKMGEREREVIFGWMEAF